ncbi:DUF1080 domain-containing protein [Arenibacter sp. F26102]|uniref:family 16 glycoside hydrolase n=1 Tax=Arenibacter sp. F26102 TaxID=2926416 RepID=UPI001FF6A0F6|nr:family 16 glycoside hydrolase [Arenibacter sp. F26102]MCK0147285.1 DUF1080 domain-containing protein [Arenibacter sp. F26102]
MITARDVILKPVGEFNNRTIMVGGNHVEHRLNGVKEVEFDYKSVHLDSLYRISKYKGYPEFIKKRKDHIVMQKHNDDAWFRNIKIRKLIRI